MNVVRNTNDHKHSLQILETDMKWTDPEFKDLRLGFEVTAYVYVR